MNKEREKRILEIMLKEKQVSVKYLSGILYASEPSVRRDLANLEAQGYVRRIHGGAVLNENGKGETMIPFLIRELEESREKLVIAEKAAALVKDGDVISINIPEYKIELLVSDGELEKRRAEMPIKKKCVSGYLKRYAKMVSSADKGAIINVKD